jgi:hypothetical protein
MISQSAAQSKRSARFDLLACDALLRYHRDDPARRRAGPIFLNRTDQPRDRQSIQHQFSLLTPALGVAAPSSIKWIRDFDSMHGSPWSRGAKQFRDDLHQGSVNQKLSLIPRAVTSPRPDAPICKA